MRDISQVDLILRDRDAAVVNNIIEANYRILTPRAEWSSATKMLVIRRPNSEIRLPAKYLEQFLEGEISLDPESERLVREWYGISRYRFYHQRHLLQKKAAEARKRKDFAEAKRLKSQIRLLHKEEKRIDFRQQKLNELAYYYQESEERIEQLFDMMYSTILTKNVNFGCITAAARPKEYAEAVSEEAYPESRGFFEDFSAAHGTIAKARTSPVYSPSAGILYNDEWVQALGYDTIEVDGEEIGMNCAIQKDTIRDFLAKQIETMPLDFDAERFASHLEVMLSDYALAKTEDIGERGRKAREYYFGGYEKNMAFMYRADKTFLFAGDPEVLKEDIPRILHVALALKD